MDRTGGNVHTIWNGTSIGNGVLIAAQILCQVIGVCSERFNHHIAKNDATIFGRRSELDFAGFIDQLDGCVDSRIAPIIGHHIFRFHCIERELLQCQSCIKMTNRSNTIMSLEIAKADTLSTNRRFFVPFCWANNCSSHQRMSSRQAPSRRTGRPLWLAAGELV